MKMNSPGQEIWKRFKRNKAAFGGLLLIIVAVFISVFVYTFIPDNTPLANRMSLAISNQSPGFEVDMIKIPKPLSEDESLIEKIFFGRKDQYDFIPVAEWKREKEKVFFREYGDDSPVQQWKLASLSNDQLRNNEFIEHKTFLFGTDRYGRDLFSRVMAGTRVTFGVGLIAVVISLLLGVFLGSIAGYFKGKTDQFILWLINVIWSVPTLLLVIAITLVLGKGFSQVFIAIGLTMWVDVARIVRGQFLSLREMEYVTAGRAMGFGSGRLIVQHILPNIIGPVLVVAAANFSTAILLEAGLSFLGIGAQPPTPSWGAMIKENYGFIIISGSEYLALLPGIAIMLLTMAFTFVANGLRDAVDSKTQINF